MAGKLISRDWVALALLSADVRDSLRGPLAGKLRRIREKSGEAETRREIEELERDLGRLAVRITGTLKAREYRPGSSGLAVPMAPRGGAQC